MKKIGINVDSHQSPNQVLSQTIEFNANFVVFETGKDSSEAFAYSEKLQHLLTPPKIILIKKEDEILSSSQVLKVNIARVFSEPLDQHELIAYTLESMGYDPVESFNKYLKIDYNPKKAITPERKLVEKKFSERDYLSSFSQILDEVESDEKVTLQGAKLEEFKKQAEPVDLDTAEDDERDRFMRALLTGKPT